MDRYLQFYSSDKGITRVTISKKPLEKIISNFHTKSLSLELKSYLGGKLKSFKTSLDFQGTPFQNQVWKELLNIPYGDSYTYKDIAIKVGGSNYSRAVGMANNKNPLPIIIPCHRVIGSSGKLTGYALGLDVKEKLLVLESPQAQLCNLSRGQSI
jgi:methylated-DNA-[protein]-cysteine S-methyltransferase